VLTSKTIIPQRRGSGGRANAAGNEKKKAFVESMTPVEGGRLMALAAAAAAQPTATNAPR